MKLKILLLIIFAQISLTCHSQKAKTTSKKTTNTVLKKNTQSPLSIARRDFSSNVEYNYHYGSDAFKYWFTISARDIGISPNEIEKEVKNINKNQKLQDAFFSRINSMGGSRNFKIEQFYQIGMTIKNATILTDYMIAKYTPKVTVEEPE